MLARIIAGIGLIIALVALITLIIIFLTHKMFGDNYDYNIKSFRNFSILMITIFIGSALFIIGSSYM